MRVYGWRVTIYNSTMFPRLLAAVKAVAARLTHNVWIEATAALMLLAVGVAGVAAAVQSRPYTGAPLTDLAQVTVQVAASPNVPVLSLLILSLGVAVCGAAWFVVRAMHWRFWAPVHSGRVWRQALLVGVAAMGLTWLQLNQTLTLPLAGVLIAALGLIELYLNLRTFPRTDKPA